MSDELRPDATEDPLILSLLEELDGALAREPRQGGGREDTLRRLHVELMGLLPYAEEPVPPPPGLRARLLERLQGEATVAVGASPMGVARERREAAPQAPALPWGSRARRGTWTALAFPLAAVLALLLAGVSAHLYQRVRFQDDRLRGLADRLGQLELRQAANDQMRADLLALEDRIALVTSPGVEVCVLRPVAGSPAPAGARGVLYVAADHQHWYLALEGLEPCPRGSEYRLWFLAGEGAVDAGAFDVAPGARIELSSETMPAGTRAVQVTLEPRRTEPVPEPTGTTVLHGDEVMRIL